MLYRCDFTDPERATHWANRICEERGAPELEAEVGAHVGRVLKSSAMARVLQAQRVLKEVPVVTFNGTEYVEGIADLLFEELDGWVLVDYKTDALSGGPAAVVERYRPQIEAYAAALGRAGVTIKEVGVWLTSSGELRIT